MSNETVVRIPEETLRQFGQSVFEQLGVSADESHRGVRRLRKDGR